MSKMLDRGDLHGYQEHALQFARENTRCGLFLEPGLGKTVTSLTLIDELMYQECEIGRVLVIAPKRVAEHTWGAEIRRWSHLGHLRVEKVLGGEKSRKMALQRKADIYVINRENIPWLVGMYGTYWPFDMVVVDEMSSFKNQSSERFKALRKVIGQSKRVIGLTGTPVSNGLIDLWAQVYLLDAGQRLYDTISKYRARYFSYNQWSRKYTPVDDAEQAIYQKIGDICVSMKAEDYLDLPGRIDNVVDVHLDAKTMESYLKFEEEQVLALLEHELTVTSAAALSTKLRQFANGAVYDEDRTVHEVHKFKLDALEELIEGAQGKPVLVFYQFEHDRDRILKRFGGVYLKSNKEIDKWNRGEIELMLAHPQSAGHGLNLQAGGHIIAWFGLTWGLEYFIQAVDRLDRQGQLELVINNMLLTKGTIDYDVLKSLGEKTTVQDALMDAVKARIEKYKKLKQ
jgi:SNF2 family DNA or RNA helicase